MEEEGFVEYLPIISGACRPDLYVAKTRLITGNGPLYDFWGLFCHNHIARDAFIGMYAGTWIHSDEVFPFGSRYALEVASSLLVAPPGQRPDPQRYPIAMANEPAPGKSANATMREYTFGRHDVSNIPAHIVEDVFHGVGLVACEDILRDTEILWYYGPSYAGLRNYPVNSIGCDTTSTISPPHALGHALPYESVSPMLATPSASDDEDEDPSYQG